MKRREREALLESLMLEEPELTFTAYGNPDPRLLRLTDFLARQGSAGMLRRRGSDDEAAKEAHLLMLPGKVH